MTAQRIVLELIKKMIAAALLFALSPAAAFPNPGAAMRTVQKPASHPSQILEAGFSELLGRPLNRGEVAQIESTVDEMIAIQERPQKVSWIGDAISRSEIRPVVCLYGKITAQLPKIGEITVGGVSGSAEILPCLMLNSLNPFSWNAKEFRSYVLQGFGFGPTLGYGGISGGLLVGAYMGPKNLPKPMIGAYAYGRYTLDKGVAKFSLQVAYSSNNQLLVLPGVGAELSFESILKTLKVLPSLKTEGGATVADAVTKKQRIDGGIILNIFEFPWFERLVMQGMSPVEAFRDVDQYMATK